MAEINSSRVSTSKALTNVIQQNMMNMKGFFFFFLLFSKCIFPLLFKND